jgi:hypothetical protein
MTKVLSLTLCAFVSLLCGARSGWTQESSLGVSFGDIANLGNFGLNPGLVGGGESPSGAILVKIHGEVQCIDCTLEEMGVEETPGDLYQMSYGNTHFVVKVTKAVPDMAWELVERHKLFLQSGEDPIQLQRLLDGNAPGRFIDVTAGVAPSQGNLIPVLVKVK